MIRKLLGGAFALVFALLGARAADAQGLMAQHLSTLPTVNLGTGAGQSSFGFLQMDGNGILYVDCYIGCGGGGGGGGGGVIEQGGSAVSSSNPLYVQPGPGGFAVNLGAALPAGSNAIGTVGVTALPALPSGSNAIGTVGVTALPALPAGSNTIGNVGVASLPALPAGSNAIGTVGVTALPALPAGSNTIGAVSQNGTWAVNCSNCSGGSGGDVSQGGTDVSSSNALYVQPGTGGFAVSLGAALPAGTNTIGAVAEDGVWSFNCNNCSSSGGSGGNVEQGGSNVASGNALYVQPGTGGFPVTLSATQAFSTAATATNAAVGVAGIYSGFNTPILSQGQAVGLQVDGTGNLLSTSWPTASGQQAPLEAQSAAAGSALVVKTATGNLYHVAATNFTATAGYLAIIDAAAAPSTGSAITPLICRPLPANGTVDISFGTFPARFNSGITALLTSAANCFTYTSGTITGFVEGYYE